MLSDDDIGIQIHEFARELWQFNRSITGEGVRQTLFKIQKKLPNLKILSVPSGTNVFDWTVPPEWKVNKAYIISPSGRKLCDFSQNNLHLVGYSNSFEGRLPLKDLLPNLYTLKEQPQAVPYVTNYYSDGWGFCIPFEEYDLLEDGVYTVVVDTEHFDGILNYAELIIKGDTEEEVFLSTYICHPSMANNELSGPCVLTFIADWLQCMTSRRYTYRIVFVPETIGSLVYLHERLDELKAKVVAGFNISCIGDDRCFSYLPSRHGSTPSDIAAIHALKWTDPNFIKYSWLDRGSDERQYCAPGIDLPIASIMRSKYGTYPEYHTSLDDLDNVVTPAGLRGGFGILKSTIQVLERNYFYRATVLGEPQLSRRGLYPTVSSKNVKAEARLFIDILSMADGRTSLIEIVDALKVSVWDVESVINRLTSVGLLERSE